MLLRNATIVRLLFSLAEAIHDFALKAGQKLNANRFVYFNLTSAGWETAALAPTQQAARSLETFEAAQWASQQATAAALAQMAARFAAGTGPLAGLVRERQDLIRTWQTLDGQLVAAVSATGQRRNEVAIAELRAAIAATDRRLADLSARLEREVPGYAELASPKPLPAPEVQRLLAPGEALIVSLDGDKDDIIPSCGRSPARG